MGEREALLGSAVLTFRGLVRELVEYVSRELGEGHRFVFAMETMGTAERLRDILRDYGLAPVLGGEKAPLEGPLFISVGDLGQGFTLPELGCSFFRQQDVLGEEKRPAHRAPEQDTRGVFISASTLLWRIQPSTFISPLGAKGTPCTAPKWA